MKPAELRVKLDEIFKDTPVLKLGNNTWVGREVVLQICGESFTVHMKINDGGNFTYRTNLISDVKSVYTVHIIRQYHITLYKKNGCEICDFAVIV